MKQCPFCDSNLPENECKLELIKPGEPDNGVEFAPAFRLKVTDKNQPVFTREMLLTSDTTR